MTADDPTPETGPAAERLEMIQKVCLPVFPPVASFYEEKLVKIGAAAMLDLLSPLIDRLTRTTTGTRLHYDLGPHDGTLKVRIDGWAYLTLDQVDLLDRMSRISQ